MTEFFTKFPDHKNATFEETDAAQDEDQWEYGHCSHEKVLFHMLSEVCYASLQALPANDPQGVMA